MTGRPDTALTARGLVKRYGAKCAVDGVDLTARTGEVVGLLGPNGAGKTTTFYMIVGLVSADEGTITLGELELSGLPMYKRARLGLGYLAQEPSVFRRLTVRQNVFGVLEARGVDKDEADARTESALEALSIRHIEERRGSLLSGGERRRVEIARVLATDPLFVLLDEPFAGIDPIAVGEIKDRVTHLTDLGIGVVITDHNVRETLSACDHAYILSDGKVLEEGEPETIVASPLAREIYLGEDFKLD